MAIKDDDQIFTDEAIRDTTSVNSGEADIEVYIAETIFIKNGLNQAVNFQLQGGRNSDWVNIGSSFSISASTNGYRTVSDYFFKYRLQASCAIAPTTGNLNVWFIKRSG